MVYVDNRYVAGSSTPISRRDEFGNTYQLRSLKDGTHYEVLKTATIMMVDDEPTTTEVIQTFLEDEGYSNFVTTEHSVEDGSRSIRSSQRPAT